MQLLKKQTIDEAKDNIDYRGQQCDLKARSETELIKGCKRRDNVGIIGIPENPNVDENGRRIYESNEESIEKLTKIATAIGAYISESDVSIAHRLPTRKHHPRTMIVRFTRIIGKVNLLRNKKKLFQSSTMRDVKIFEDLTAPGVKFLHLMKKDAPESKLSGRARCTFTSNTQKMRWNIL